ncbi:MAG: SpoVG family protein [Planctomycetota bacterium]|nr:SpoVG family protein [Planctomycetota bacterium]MDA1177803.1 SpoVG family protein [Planctomycetota bacterium]
MEITEVRIKLMENSDDRLQGFCSITFDNCFVIRDLKIIEGTNGPFVAMPSRKLTSHCTTCNYKNHLRAQFCNQCGTRQSEEIPIKEEDGRTKLYADIAHPINSECREMIQRRVIEEFHAERIRAKEPGYVSRYDLEDHYPEPHAASHGSHVHRVHSGEERHNPSQRHSKRIQSPSAEPRAPHQATAREASQRSHTTDRKDDFGAGIL